MMGILQSKLYFHLNGTTEIQILIVLYPKTLLETLIGIIIICHIFHITSESPKQVVAILFSVSTTRLGDSDVIFK